MTNLNEVVSFIAKCSNEERKTIVDVVKKVSSNVFIPLTVGGGIQNSIDMELMLEAGADKVSINTAAVNNPKLINICSKQFGSQCVVVAIDVKKINDNKWLVYTHGGRTETEIDAFEWVKEVQERGAGEILLTSMDRDGSQEGYDNELLNKVNTIVSIPVIASGGAGKLQHFLDALIKGKADAVLAASTFHYGKFSIKETKDFLKKNNINIRK